MAHRILRDHGADGWERSDFPIICESCLGDNPYTRANYNKECKICTRSFTFFRWQPGRDARFKKTEICQTCSKLKNVCQVCLLDLDYGLLVQTRAGLDYGSSFGKMPPNDIISKLERTTPYYKRNRPHLCSFYTIGECNRGAGCAYRHEMPETGELSHQNIKDRYYGINDPVAMKLLGKAGDMGPFPPPEDESIRTLYVGGLNSITLEQDIRDRFYAYGEMESVRILPKKACAFVIYTTREGAEKAMQGLSNKLVVNGQRLKLTWARPPQVPKPDQGGSNQQQQGSVAHCGLLPRAVISQQTPPMQQFYMHAPGPFYPSMDPQRMGGHISTQEGGGSTSSTSENNGASSSSSSSSSHLMPPHQPYRQPPYEYKSLPYQLQYPPNHHHPGPVHQYAN